MPKPGHTRTCGRWASATRCRASRPPVRPGEPAATIDLQALLHRVYDGTGYEDSIYAEKPVPRLAPDDAAWAAQLVPNGASS
ncbi:DUF4058 family protein [bacterium]|nr:DUF4058 family protein [bacterium]